MNAAENYLKELEAFNGFNFYQKLVRRKKIEIIITKIKRLKPTF